MRLQHYFILSVVLIILTGCTPPSTLNLEKVPSIKRVGVITRLTEHDLKVFDHTGVSNKSYLKYIGGLGPLLLQHYFPIDSPIVWAEAQYAINKSLNGDPEKIKRYIASDVIKGVVDTKINEKLSKKYVITLLNQPKNPQYDDRNDKLWLAECKSLGIDTLAVVNFAYGIAAYKEMQPSVTIDGDMAVYEVNTEEILLKGTVESEQDFREHRSLEELTADNGKLFNEDLNSAINSFAYLVARKLEVW